MTDAVLGLCLNMSFEQVRPFVVSLRRYNPSASVLFFADGADPELRRELAPFDVTWCDFADAAGRHPQATRYFAYRDRLREMQGIRRVLLTDVRDVFFQDDPFAPALGNEVVVATETLSIGDNWAARLWIPAAYGEDAFRQLSPYTLLCSGTTIGTYAGILRYLELMCEEADRDQQARAMIGIDQGYHNYIVWARKPDFIGIDRDNRIVSTVGTAEPSMLAVRRNAILFRGRRSPVVHQWDRHGALRAFIASETRKARLDRGIQEAGPRPGSIEESASAIAALARVSGRFDGNGILLDMLAPGDTLVISCAGIVPGRVFYAMEHTSRSLATLKLFTCDARSLWYYDGIEGWSRSFDETIRLIGLLIEALKPRAAVSIGTSGGGYMALAVAARLGLDRALAFCPQTNIGRAWRAASNDARWPESIDRIHALAGPEGPHVIRHLIEDPRRGAATEFHVIYPQGDALDVLHARELAGCPSTRLYPVDSTEHGVSWELRRRGVLERLLDTFIRHEGEPLADAIAGLLAEIPAVA